MFVVCGNTMWSLILFLSGVICQTWDVLYQQPDICAVKGSSVVFPCSFKYPDDMTVENVLWGHERHSIFEGPFLFDFKMTNSSPRFSYIGDLIQNCSFEIHHIQHDDAGKYAFRFITGKDRYTGRHGPTLKVVDLNVTLIIPNGRGVILEGDSVNLSCTNSCDGDQRSSAFTWSHNGDPVSEGPVLYLSNLSSTNSGNYTCSLKTHTGATSTVLNIDVEYGPKNTSVSVTPSLEVETGSNVTLICSSYSNPSVENYTWFKEDENGDSKYVGDQRVLVSASGGQYLCSATNKHGSQNSSVVTVKIKELWIFNRNLFIIPIAAVLLIAISAFAIIRFRKNRKRVQETGCQDDMQNNDSDHRRVSDSHQSHSGSLCEAVTPEVVYATIDFHSKRKPNMEQQMDSHDDDHKNVIYSTVCRNLPSNS